MSVFLLFICLLIVYRWPSWIRNLPALRTTHRLTYSGNNLDVSLPGFLVQECLASMTCALLVVLWLQWIYFIVEWRFRLRLLRPQLQIGDKLADFLESLTQLYFHWQVCSALLAAAFIPYTVFFWDYVLINHDQRYVAHALTMHALWATSWILLSLPLACTWYEWRVKYELPRQAHLVSAPWDGADMSSRLNTLEPPIGSLNVVGSLIGAAVTFAFPILKELLTHL
jgi:hypothetical protein